MSFWTWISGKPACPKCSSVLNLHTSIGTSVAPKEGDFTVCINCCLILRFGARNELRALSEIDHDFLKETPSVVEQLLKIVVCIEVRKILDNLGE